MLFKLSLRNIKRSLKDYLIYFFTLVLGVAIFYIFNSLESQTVMMTVSENTHDLIATMTTIMSVLSVLVAIVLGFLIIYASRFLMKRRKREFGIYMTLGIGKAQISRILLVETLIIGIVSLAAGLVVGVILSQLMSVFVANMFEADMTNFRFIFSTSAFWTTIGLFGLIYLIVMAFNVVAVGKQKLINLIKSDKVVEKLKVRNLAVSLSIFIASVALLTYAYLSVTTDYANLSDEKLLLCIAFGIVGTFLLFWSLSGLALRVIMRFKKFYYKSLNMFIFRELNSKINTTIISMSIISLLLFLTICIFSSAVSIKNSMTANLQELIPMDFQASKFMLKEVDMTDAEDIRVGRLSATEVMKELGVDIDSTFSEYAEINVYTYGTVTYRETIGAKAIAATETSSPDLLETLLNSREYIIKESDHNQLAKLYSQDEISLAKSEYAVVANYDLTVTARNTALSELSPEIQIGETVLTPNSTSVTDGFMEMSQNKSNAGYIVVPDELDLSGHEVESFFVGNYTADSEEDKKATEASISKHLITPEVSGTYWFRAETKTRLYENSVGISAMVTFIGLYLGTIFLITSAALLGLKEISESSDNQNKYKTLRDLGVDQKTMNRALVAQIAIFFGLPLTVAIVHSIFGIRFANMIIRTFANVDLLPSIIMTAIFIVLIYGGYFIITCQTSRRIVVSKN